MDEAVPTFMRPSLLGTSIALLAQFLLGMVVNLFVVVPTVHPGSAAPEYFAGVGAVIAWALTSQWPWIALHVAFGLALSVGGLTFIVRAWRAGQRFVLVACVVGSLAAITAAFNGASFLIYGHGFSSMIMAGGFALSIGSYVVALFLTPSARCGERPGRRFEPTPRALCCRRARLSAAEAPHVRRTVAGSPQVEFADKALYHQIHPAKLLTDWATALMAAYLLWQHALVAALLIGFIPSVIASALVITFADLERLKASGFGRYIGRYMTPAMQVVRSAGAAVFWVAAWSHSPWIMALGLAAILLAWARGLL